MLRIMFDGRFPGFCWVCTSESLSNGKQIVPRVIGYPRLCSFDCRFWCAHFKHRYNDIAYDRKTVAFTKDGRPIDIFVKKKNV
jgi:hypothetical protein